MPPLVLKGPVARFLGAFLLSCVGGGVGGGVAWFSLPAMIERVDKLENRTTLIERDNAVRDIRMTALEAQATSVRLETYAEISKMREKQDDQSKALARIEGALGSRQ